MGEACSLTIKLIIKWQHSSSPSAEEKMREASNMSFDNNVNYQMATFEQLSLWFFHTHGGGYGFGTLSQRISPRLICGCSYSAKSSYCTKNGTDPCPQGQISVPKWLL